MIGDVTIKRIIQLLSQSYALPFNEVYNIYLSINSMDGILQVVDLANSNNWDIQRAFNYWKETHGK